MTLIVVDVELQRARKESVVDPFGCVMKLRENRSNIVQTEVWISDELTTYPFLYKC